MKKVVKYGVGVLALGGLIYGGVRYDNAQEKKAAEEKARADSTQLYESRQEAIEHQNRVRAAAKPKTYSVGIIDDKTGTLESYVVTKTHNLDQVFTGRNNDPYIHPEASDHAQKYGIVAVPVTSPKGLEGELQKVFHAFGIDDPINDPRYMEAANALGELNAHIGANRYPGSNDIPYGTMAWVPLPSGELDKMKGVDTIPPAAITDFRIG